MSTTHADTITSVRLWMHKPDAIKPIAAKPNLAEAIHPKFNPIHAPQPLNLHMIASHHSVPHHHLHTPISLHHQWDFFYSQGSTKPNKHMNFGGAWFPSLTSSHFVISYQDGQPFHKYWSHMSMLQTQCTSAAVMAQKCATGMIVNFQNHKYSCNFRMVIIKKYDFAKSINNVHCSRSTLMDKWWKRWCQYHKIALWYFWVLLNPK